ncbi:hypothetical protein O181_038687 [Austropuccinia psidii MF-1]|uniref:Uncharacterized protein n=1 Tax=Austropuccinia psidii MF-1 TaxID=1389203 RepID=A0A9Q3HC50_9BASI|nr:hypothetical protein [Austropuccinia psidii MF-1]
MIQTVEDIIRRFCAYGLQFKGSNGFTHYWCTLILPIRLAYKISICSSHNKTPAMFEKGCNPKLPYDTLNKGLVDINPTASSFEIILDKERHDEDRCMQDYFKYAKERCNKTNQTPNFKIEDLVIVSKLNFEDVEVPKKL